MARVLTRSRPEAPAPGARRFKALAFVSKAYEDDKGDWWLEGAASGPAMDAHGERMSPECVADMGDQMNAGQIRLLTGHFNDWEGVLGWIKGGEVNLAGLLTVRCWLDKLDADVQKLWRQLQGDAARGIEPAKLGLSVGGWLIDGHTEIVDGESVFSIDKLQLDHVAVTSRPANPEAWITDVEVKHKEFARPWLRDIAKVATSEMRRVLRNGGDPLDEEVREEVPPADDAEEATKTEGPDIESIVKAAFDAAIATIGEVVKAEMGAAPVLKYIRAIDLIGDEFVAVKDESVVDAGEADEGDDDEAEPPAGEKPDDAEKEKNVKSGDVLDLLAKARLRSRRLEEENAGLRKSAGLPARGEGQRRGIRDTDEDEAVGKARQGDSVTKEKPAQWLEDLKKTPEYEKANNLSRIQLVRAALPKAMGKALVGSH